MEVGAEGHGHEGHSHHIPISLAVIVVPTFFAGAWAVSENAVRGETTIYTSSAAPVIGAVAGSDTAAESSERGWYEKTAIWVCPLH